MQITSDNVESEDVRTYNAPEMPDTVKRGDYRLFKEVSTTSDDDDQAFTRIAVEGTRFEVANESGHPVTSPDTLEEVAPGGVVTTLVTDENGFATAQDHVPEGWTAALAYGEYRLHEVISAEVAERVKRNHGVTLVAVDDWHVAITEEGQYDPVQVVANRIAQTPLVIQKADADMGLAIPLACSLQISDEEGELVTYEDRMGECVLDTWTTARDGCVTLPMKLKEGAYTLREVAAPEATCSARMPWSSRLTSTAPGKARSPSCTPTTPSAGRLSSPRPTPRRPVRIRRKKAAPLVEGAPLGGCRCGGESSYAAGLAGVMSFTLWPMVFLSTTSTTSVSTMPRGRQMRAFCTKPAMANITKDTAAMVMT